jgi:hypothetical protein
MPVPANAEHHRIHPVNLRQLSQNPYTAWLSNAKSVEILRKYIFCIRKSHLFDRDQLSPRFLPNETGGFLFALQEQTRTLFSACSVAILLRTLISVASLLLQSNSIYWTSPPIPYSVTKGTLMPIRRSDMPTVEPQAGGAQTYYCQDLIEVIPWFCNDM